jgi:hypothetical protein
LPSLVRARTIDVERHLERYGNAFAQVLVLGVGFDPKPVRFNPGELAPRREVRAMGTVR